jgi:cysteine desulfurase family protein
MTRRRIYLDNAATSWPKPAAVYEAVEHYQRELGGPLGRGTYHEAVEIERTVARLRNNLAQLIGADEPRRIVFTANCTAALNQAIHGLLRAGDHVVTSVVEHNSVLRPLRLLEDENRICVTRVACDARGMIDPDAVRQAMTRQTRLVVVTHASNVTGAIQPVEAIGVLAKERGAAFLVDAAQTAGHVPIDVKSMQADLLAAPGHKGLLGPLGTGLLYVGPDVERRLRPLMQGGTGSQSEEDRQPEHLPDRFEAGNLNAPGLVGLAAGVEFVLERGVDSIRAHEQALLKQLVPALRDIDGVTLHPDSEALHRVGVVSLTQSGFDPQELAAILDASHGIQGRAGLHCAPCMHRALGTLQAGGTFRLSVGPFNTEEDIRSVLASFEEFAAD